jgi:hypothetical protein
MYYLVFIRIFKFLFGRFDITQVFFHCCLIFLDFLGHVMYFCKSNCVVLIDTYYNPLQTSSFVVAY